MSKKFKPQFSVNNTGEYDSNYRRTGAIIDKNINEQYREINEAQKKEREGEKDYHKDGVVYRLFSTYDFLDSPKGMLTTQEDIKSFKYGYVNLANLQLEVLASKLNKENENFHVNETIISILTTILKTGKSDLTGKGKIYSSKEKLYVRTIISLINGSIPESREERDKAIEKRKMAVNELLYKIGKSDAANGIVIPSEKYPLITTNESYISGYSSILETKNSRNKK